MAKKKETIPSGFEDILGNIYSNAEIGEGITDMDEELPINTPLVEENNTEEPPVNTEDGNETDDAVVNDDDSQIPEGVLNGTQNVEDQVEQQTEEVEEPSNADVHEAENVGLLFDAVAESLGWNVADIDEKERPVTVDELTNYLAETVRQNSVPTYADERIQALDEYVKNGGKFEDFYSVQKEQLTLDSINLEDENNQKAVVKELLKHEGYTDDQINKRVSRYEDADMLYEESEDALERLKVIRKQEQELAAKQQEEYMHQQQEKQRAFFTDVTNNIKGLTNIRGIAIPKEDRAALFEYIFKVDQNGVSQYQKDFNANLTKNLIESAYFTMKADALISSAKKNGESSAADKLRKMLRHSTKNHSTYNVEDKKKSVIDLASGLF